MIYQKYLQRPWHSRTFVVVSVVFTLAGCQTSATTNCAGWKQISVKPDTAVYLAGKDLKAGQGIAGHNAFGKSRGCWK